MNSGRLAPWTAAALLAAMGLIAGSAAMRESVTYDEVTHIGAGVSYLQKLDMRMNPEHPPLAKVLATIPLVLRRARSDYADPSWSVSAHGWPSRFWLSTRRYSTSPGILARLPSVLWQLTGTPLRKLHPDFRRSEWPGT